MTRNFPESSNLKRDNFLAKGQTANLWITL